MGGGRPLAAVVSQLPRSALVVAADSGLDAALALGLSVAAVVGDFDSVSAEALARAEATGTAIERHPTDKDATDAELAFDAAIALGAASLTLVSPGGDRLDHLLGALGALAHPRFGALEPEGWVGEAWVGIVHGPGRRQVAGRPGEYVSLLPFAGPASGVRTQGLRWTLNAETLSPTSTRAVSNELMGAVGAVAVEAGTLFVIRPYALRQ